MIQFLNSYKKNYKQTPFYHLKLLQLKLNMHFNWVQILQSKIKINNTICVKLYMNKTVHRVECDANPS